MGASAPYTIHSAQVYRAQIVHVLVLPSSREELAWQSLHQKALRSMIRTSKTFWLAPGVADRTIIAIP